MRNRLMIHLAAVVSAVLALMTAIGPRQAAAQSCQMDTLGGDRVALVVGTDDYSVYPGGVIKNLDNAIHDARTIAGVLSEQGFKVRCLINPTKLLFDTEKTALEVYLSDRTRDDAGAADAGRAVIYVAGHGYRDPQNGNDYLLFRFEPDPSKYSGVVDLQTHAGRVAQGRFSILSLVDGFSKVGHGVVFVFDACRSLVDVGMAAGPAQRLLDAQLTGRQIVVYSTQPGGFAADGVPGSPDQNGLYTSVLARLMDLPIVSFGHTLGLTATVVTMNKPDQAPGLSLAPKTLFLRNPWFERESVEDCDLVDSAIWNAAGKNCELFSDPACLRKDICKAVRPLLDDSDGSKREKAKACLARHQAKWFRKDFINICGPSPAPGPVAAPLPPPPLPAGPIAGISNPVDMHAFSVTTFVRPGFSVRQPGSQDLNEIALSTYANKAPSLFAVRNGISPEGVTSFQSTLDDRLSKITNPRARQTFTTSQRDVLMTRTAERIAPQAAPSPFIVDMKGRNFTLRNLPSVNAGPIGTFSGDEVTASVDCVTIPCTNDWIGLRVTKDKTVFRGWVTANEIKANVRPARSIEIKYEGRRVAPIPDSIAALRHAIKPNETSAMPAGRIQMIATRGGNEDTRSVFIAGARLAFLDRLLVDLGVPSDDIVKNVIEVPDATQLPTVLINLGAAR